MLLLVSLAVACSGSRDVTGKWVVDKVLPAQGAPASPGAPPAGAPGGPAAAAPTFPALL